MSHNPACSYSSKKVTFIFRSLGTGYSIENIFSGFIKEMDVQGLVLPDRFVLPYISRGLRSVWQNIRAVRQARLSLVHITGDVHYVALGTRASQTVLTIHDCVILDRNRHSKVRFWLFWLLWYYLPMRHAAVVTTISEKTRRELHQYVGRLANKVVVVPNGYDPVFTYSPKPFNTDRPTLLHIGTAPHKNLSRLMEAVAGLPCQLLIVGKLTDAEVDELISRRIDYQQFVNISQAEMVALYKQCDLVTFVSLYEGFGMPVLEGQAVGRPVLTSNLSPMTEVGGAGACYVDPTDAGAIRSGVLRIWQDDAYRAGLIRAGLENAKQYTVEKVAAHYAELYRKLG